MPSSASPNVPERTCLGREVAAFAATAATTMGRQLIRSLFAFE